MQTSLPVHSNVTSTPSSSSSPLLWKEDGGFVRDKISAARPLAPSSCPWIELEKMLDGVTASDSSSSGVDVPELLYSEDEADEELLLLLLLLLPLEEDGCGTTKPCVAKPFFSAYSTRPASTSLMVTEVQPDCRAMAAVSKPTVPAPMTRAVEPGVGLARFTAWMATDKGSRRAAASKETWSGSLQWEGVFVR